MKSPRVEDLRNAGRTSTQIADHAAVQGGFDVAHSLTPGSAEAADLIVLTPSPIHFDGDANEFRYVLVRITGDDLAEDDETFTITLGDVTNTTLSTN